MEGGREEGRRERGKKGKEKKKKDYEEIPFVLLKQSIKSFSPKISLRYEW